MIFYMIIVITFSITDVDEDGSATIGLSFDLFPPDGPSTNISIEISINETLSTGIMFGL